PSVHVCERDFAGIVCRGHFYFVAVPLDEVLMHCGRDTTVGMNPFPPKQHCVCTLVVNDEERCWYSLAAHCQFHIKNPLRLRWLSIEVIKHHIGLDQISRRTTQSAQHKVWHQVDCGTSVDQHPFYRLAIDEALEIQSLQVLV